LKVVITIFAIFVIFISLSCGFATGRYDGGENEEKDSDSLSDDDDSGAGGLGGNKIENFTWTTVDGDTLELYDYEGYVILLSVGAGWCAECKKETPVLENEFWQVYKKQDFVVIQTLTSDASGAPADTEFAKEWQSEYGVTFPLCIDPDSSLEPYYKEASLPFTMLVDKGLIIRERSHGFDKEIFKVLVETYL